MSDGRLSCDGCGVLSWSGAVHAAGCPVTVSVTLGAPDLRPSTARIVAGVQDYPVAVHRATRPPVVSVDREVAVPPARAVAGGESFEEAVRVRRDVTAPSGGAPVGRPGRVPFVEAPYRRRVRLGIDT